MSCLLLISTLGLAFSLSLAFESVQSPFQPIQRYRSKKIHTQTQDIVIRSTIDKGQRRRSYLCTSASIQAPHNTLDAHVPREHTNLRLLSHRRARRLRRALCPSQCVCHSSLRPRRHTLDDCDFFCHPTLLRLERLSIDDFVQEK